MKQRSFLYTTVPLLALVGGVLLYSASELVFWRVLAYLAVFHFIRQQYGFMRIYARGQSHSRIFWERYERPIDAAAIYLATLYPLVYRHTHHHHFQWFVEGDFFEIPYSIFVHYCRWSLCPEPRFILHEGNLPFQASWFLNAPKNLLLGGTALSWYFGIVYFNGDLTFTLTNVVSHGVPYFALIWDRTAALAKTRARKRLFGGVSGFRSKKSQKSFLGLDIVPFLDDTFRLRFLGRKFVGFLVVARACINFWGLFPFYSMGHPTRLALVGAIVGDSQATHYLLDAFIWRLRDEKSDWKQLVFQNAN